MDKVILEVKNIDLYDTFKNFSISFIKNKLISISGPNNCGKTALIKILANIIEKDTIFLNKKKYSSYSVKELNKSIQYIIPDEIAFIYDKVENNIDYNGNLELIKKLKLTKIKSKRIKELEIADLIKLKLLLCLMNNPQVLLLDDIYKYLTIEDKSIIIKILKDYRDIHNLTIIQTNSDLKDSLNSDYLYLINKNQIILEGEPLDILQNDNIINKMGLELPFLIDLSVKLRDYELVSKIITNEKELVEEIWKD